MITRRGFVKLAAAAWFALLSLPAYAAGVEAMGRPRVRNYSVVPPNWTPGLKLKIVALADFHACEPWMSASRIAAICDEANALGGDIILLLGDYATGMKFITDTVPYEQTAQALTRLKAPLGVHAILGNHDYWQDDAFQADPSRRTAVEQALEAVGIPVYLNRSIRLEKDGMPFWLGGLADQIAIRRPKDNGWVEYIGIEDMDKTLASVTDDAPMVLMAHEPYVFDSAPDRISIILSGHTHGGQINLFGWTPFVMNPSDLPFLGGAVERNGRHLYVSRGLGCSGIPMRMGAWPEISVIELG